MANKIEVLKADNKHLYSLCVAVRYAVFVIEQVCPILEEYDALEDDCVHFIALEEGGQPLGTARWRLYDGKAKIERVATLEAARGKGVAKSLMKTIIEDIEAGENAVSEVILGAQDHAQGFYEALGFAAYGDGFMEAGIPHHMMRKTLH